jgi:hypothetical protein
MAIIVFAFAKMASTTYRFARYYAGQREYVEKGPPPTVLRVLGPVVTLTTVAVLATGVGALFAAHAHWLAFAHKVTFIVWFAAMSVHVLGHALETPALAFADWHRTRRLQVAGASARLALLAAALVGALSLAVLSTGWAHHWHKLHP